MSVYPAGASSICSMTVFSHYLLPNSIQMVLVLSVIGGAEEYDLTAFLFYISTLIQFLYDTDDILYTRGIA